MFDDGSKWARGGNELKRVGIRSQKYFNTRSTPRPCSALCSVRMIIIISDLCKSISCPPPPFCLHICRAEEREMMTTKDKSYHHHISSTFFFFLLHPPFGVQYRNDFILFYFTQRIHDGSESSSTFVSTSTVLFCVVQMWTAAASLCFANVYCCWAAKEIHILVVPFASSRSDGLI